MVGEGIKIVAVLAGATVAAALFVAGAQKLGREWSKAVDADLGGDADRQLAHDGARIPELAAATFGQTARGCGCAACRRQGRGEPCSDYDGD